MKRPPGIWILLSAGVLWLSLQDVYGIRATALIFGKTTTTTTTTTEGTASSESSDETATEASTEGSNVTKATLTGVPQVDYIWDPNLPKELNGYNLSEYPFYERVPEDIDFKCDGLHDGFYASVPHKCQVYHHCLFGTRYDFLCANYTAFDQKTFICHFVSEVDCVNSKKYWHRNDALYQAASTSTVKPLIVYTPPSQPHPAAAAAAPGPSGPRRPGGRRRPLRRRRPQYDYYEYDDEYDDYYEERPRAERRRKRPRPRPRPVYDDDYEEYEDDRYERRGSGRRDEERNRKNYDRRGSDDRRERRRNKDRRKFEDEDRMEDEDKVEEERKSEKRTGDRRYHKRRPVDDSSGEEEDRRRSRPKGGSRRPIEDDYEEEKEEEVSHSDKTDAGDKPMIKPTSGTSIYDRPRAAPRIKPPVPKSEASKYAYKPIATTKATPSVEDEEYYDDYEDEPPVKSHRKSEMSESKRHSSRREEERDTRKQLSSRQRTASSRDDDEEETPRRQFKPKHGTQHRERTRATHTNKKSPPVDDYYEDYEDEVSKESSRTESKVLEKTKEKSTTTTTTTTTTPKPTTTTTTTTTTPKPTTTAPKELRPEAIVRIVKRPFLPSRGGNPYSTRGLQPVGAKALDKKLEIKETEGTESEDETMEVKEIFKPSHVIIKMPHRQKYSQAQTDSREEVKSVPKPPLPARGNFKHNKEYSGPRTTQKPKLPDDHDPLDIEGDEYDVTLNDALNPTLPNLPVRGYPTGFSSPSDYSYNTFQRPRYVLEEAANTNYYQAKPVRQRYEAVSYNNNPQDHLVSSEAEYKGQFSTINRESYRPRVTQAYFTRF